MSLFSLLDVSLSFGGPPVLENLNFQVDSGERLCLLGRNGAGKSTLMKVIAGQLKPDSGSVFRQPESYFTFLPQDIPSDITGSIHDIVASGLRPLHEHEEEWQRELQVEQLINRLQLQPQLLFNELSGGMKRRTLLARALAGKPDLLLLDEPTNHLDIDSIVWLEEFLLNEKLTLLFVSHDRVFLKKIATRIVELDRGVLTNWDCPYETYLVRRQERLEVEEREFATANKKLAQEEEWARRQPSARRTKAAARIQQLAELRTKVRERRKPAGTATLSLADAERSGQKVIETKQLFFSYSPESPPLIRNLDTTIMRGDKIGIIGPNGSGKTTLIKLLLGQLTPSAGGVTHGTNLQITYLDQLRAQIDDNKTVADNIADGNTTVSIEGKTRHVISYLQDFLFEPERSRTPARVLSGGERNRLLLARLFTKPTNILVLDEPTNDLDSETLDLLENLLVDYSGTLLLVSHDRDFLDNVVTSTLVLEGGGHVNEYVGGYSDWLHEKQKQGATQVSAETKTTADTPSASTKNSTAKKLSNKEREELKELPGKIETLEQEQAELTEKLSDPDLYKKAPQESLHIQTRLHEIEEALLNAYERWEQLDSRPQ